MPSFEPPASRIARAVVTDPQTNVLRVRAQHKLAPGVFHFTAEPYSAIVVVTGHARTLPRPVLDAARENGYAWTAKFAVGLSLSGKPRMRLTTGWSNFEAEVMVFEEEERDLILSQCVTCWVQYAQLMADPNGWLEQWPMSVLARRLIDCDLIGAPFAEHLQV